MVMMMWQHGLLVAAVVVLFAGPIFAMKSSYPFNISERYSRDKLSPNCEGTYTDENNVLRKLAHNCHECYAIMHELKIAGKCRSACETADRFCGSEMCKEKKPRSWECPGEQHLYDNN